MASGTNYSQEYGQAEKAYLESDFSQAAKIIDHLAEEFPNDPNVLLLRGHIYCYGFQNYELARKQYESVLKLSEEQDLLDFASSGIEQVEQLQQQSEDSFDESNFELTELLDEEAIEEAENSIEIDFADDNKIEENFVSEDFDLSHNLDSEFNDAAIDSDINHSFIPSVEDSFGNPFAGEQEPNSEDLASTDEDSDAQDPFAQFEQESSSASEDLPAMEQLEVHNSSTFMVDSEDEDDFLPEYDDEELAVNQTEYQSDYDDSSELEIDTVLTEPFSMEANEDYGLVDVPEQEGLDYQDELEFDEIDSSFFDLEELEQGLPDTGLFNVPEDANNPSLSLANDLAAESSELNPEEIAISDPVSPTTTAFSALPEEPQVDVNQGALASFINAPMSKKQLLTAGVTGLVSAIAVLVIGTIGSTVLKSDSAKPFKGIPNNLVLALVAGASSLGTAAVLGNITAKHVAKASQDLQTQFDDVYQGNLNAQATVYAQDEFGQLANGFNRMTRVILTTTQEAQRRAEETEQAKEDLQRQVIRLLDDVEGAARGDLTVQATVTADVLGAVADAFNLTIQSLREIVRQVKEAAEQVNKGSTDSELFARNQSSEALRMAEELAVTLNSVQMMTESIERVAENAREAEEVARSSSVTALKGGKAVERTVSGIFQIRETVSETARKVKRLAEASQEISKIVLLISQIAERTNQLALNASIQAAKAGEAGRGFAVVADEVRQLADRSAKSLKEIEQIVLQIQSETGSVMTAMEEGIQEVIDVTDRAEQAKTALEDIIQVSNRIDTLVRSITADTVEQRENSRAVAQVMQSVELTAQATSQESQRVGGALQSLVGIARGLLSSVERFRIDKGEE
ncbi:methyl-accepting chemotaxis protein [Pleurocapsa sp. PCC 7319]|uniref:methyl-accepting chemotaxis protein n=1 Tax=Pleurocapsa sp. PCC 7319 TaxID=118161 RepID=UPI00034D09ED|nr:methyl-accepting chemotaxis protein [Pleurocapsa sp. PCC 7319]